ncbi:MAG: radical SAM family heme chaperone HemW [Gemmatimonadales bacterium]
MHLYVHVPFCSRRCTYCDFAIAVRRRVPAEQYLAAVLQEWSGWQSHSLWDESPGLDTIYLGGGTPSLLPPPAVAGLLDRLRSDQPVSADAEITLEANPDDVGPAAAQTWRAAGINRVSLGAQSFSPNALRWMHRTHGAEQIERAVDVLRAAGFPNLSLDLIYGLPEDVPRNWPADLERALALQPEHLSLYGLTIEPGTTLSRWTLRGETRPASDERAAAEYLEAHHRLGEAGYAHYEVSNAARPGFGARHNSAYWARRPFVGIGPSAHSGFGITRQWNVREWEEYRRRAAAGEPLVAETEILAESQIALEELYLGLRTADGVPATRLPGALTSQWCESGWALPAGQRVRLTAEGWLRLDALVASVADY